MTKVAKEKAPKSVSKKSSIHPKFRFIDVVETSGNTFKVASCYGQDTLTLSIDPRTHPAWTKELGYIDQKAGNVAKFNDRFGGLFGKKTDTTASA